MIGDAKIHLITLMSGDTLVAKYVDGDKTVTIREPVAIQMQPARNGLMDMMMINYGFPFLVKPEGKPLAEMSINKDAVLWAVPIENNLEAKKLLEHYRNHISPIQRINTSGLSL